MVDMQHPATKVYEVALTLSNGETRHLGGAGGYLEDATKSLAEFEAKEGRFSGEFVDTVETTAVARAHVVEVRIVAA